MKKVLGLVLMAMLLCSLTACGAASKGGTQNLKGTSVTEMEKRFQVGVTTKADVEKWLGTPTGIEKGNGGDTWIYRLSNDESRVRPETFLPYIGGLVGGVDHRHQSRELKIKFSTNGTLQSYAFDSMDKAGTN